MMRLLTYDNHHGFSLTPDIHEDELPPYAILSHTWGADCDEVTFADLQCGPDRYPGKAGYEKIRFCGEQANKDGIEHFWVDTCCIDKANHSELSEAITSMYRWYHEAKKCYVYLTDVSTPDSRGDDVAEFEWAPQLRTSRWFLRGWTLQELLAPRVVEFYSRTGDFLGTKETLAQQIHEITSIPLAALYGSPLSQFSIAERWQWTKKRQTKKKEDQAYCLLGIFGVFMPLIYGEGTNALRRLEKKISNRFSLDNGTQVYDNDETRTIYSCPVPVQRIQHPHAKDDLSVFCDGKRSIGCMTCKSGSRPCTCSDRLPSGFTISSEDLANRDRIRVANPIMSHAAEDEKRRSATDQQIRLSSEACDVEGTVKARHHRGQSASPTSTGAQVFIALQDDLTKPATSTRGDEQHRVFFLRKHGSDWTQSSCTEQSMSADEIRDRIKHGSRKSRRQKQNIKWTLERLESRRRSAIEQLLQQVNRTGSLSQRWQIVAVDNENAKLTKRTGEVNLLCVILVKVFGGTDQT